MILRNSFLNTGSQSWICPKCKEELGEYNGYCEYCWTNNRIKVYNPDKYYIREIRIRHIFEDGDETVTPQEDLYAELFNKHINILHPWVRDMDLLEIRAYREKMSKIALEGKAAVYASDQAEREVLKNKTVADGKVSGFSRSVNIDETSKNAINTIKERQKRLTGREKVLSGLIEIFQKSGMTQVEAEKEAETRMGAGAILARLKDKAAKDIMTGVNEKTKTESKPIFNPFEKKQ